MVKAPGVAQTSASLSIPSAAAAWTVCTQHMRHTSSSAYQPSPLICCLPHVDGCVHPQVYTTLTLALAVATAGVFADVTLHVGGMLTTIAAFVSLMWLAFTPAAPDTLVSSHSVCGLFMVPSVWCPGVVELAEIRCCCSLVCWGQHSLFLLPGFVWHPVMQSCAQSVSTPC